LQYVLCYILNIKKIGVIKKLYLAIKQLQRDNVAVLFDLGYVDLFPSPNFYTQNKHEVKILKEMANVNFKLAKIILLHLI